MQELFLHLAVSILPKTIDVSDRVKGRRARLYYSLLFSRLSALGQFEMVYFFCIFKDTMHNRKLYIFMNVSPALDYVCK